MAQNSTSLNQDFAGGAILSGVDEGMRRDTDRANFISSLVVVASFTLALAMILVVGFCATR